MTDTAKKTKSKTAKIKTTKCYSTGRRKTAIARVFLIPGKGNITINNKSLEKYFARETSHMLVRQPLEALASLNKFDIRATVKGGGSSGQAGAVRLGIARALVKFDEQGAPKEGIELVIEGGKEEAPITVRKTLRRAKLLTRDPRVVERKKVGRHKARKGTQFSKR